ncbi:unnamed protein product [Meganyctiphanes norvegica]|uniref:Uncharacterized protein n=1 Tax=Meganyctiphanes norvegica TaxID=48144 RepID=A0AAV2RIL6_MEGNR
MQVLIEQKRQYIFINKIWKNGHDAQKEQFNFYKRFPKLNKHFKPHGIATNYVKPIAANMSSKTKSSPTFITLVGVLSVAVQLVVCGAGRVGDLRLVAGGYEGLAITISDSLPQQQCNQIIHGLKAMLSEFSKALHDSTDGRASLRDVTVILPRSWSLKSPTCTLWEPVIISALPTPSHIRVASSHPVFGDNPWVQQSQGCGRQGDFIQMGGNLLRATTNSSYSAAGRLLLAQWVKFRWGVFDEHGYEGDPLYPASYLDHVTGKLRPNTCKIPAKQLPYCAIEDHVPEAPTKQNVQCEGRAAWDIILHSNDFNNQRDMMHNGTDKLAPDIHFMQPGPPRIVIVVEDTAVMNLQRRWEFVRKALRRTVVYDVPDGAHVAVVVFNSVARTATALSKVDADSDVRQRIGSSLPRNPSQVPESHKCLLCGFQEALRALDSDVNGAEGATVVLLTTGAMEVSIQELDEINHLAKQRNIQVEAVIYPFTEKSGSVTNKHGLEDIVKNTHGSAYTVMDEGVGNDSKLHMMVALMNSLREVIRHSSSSGTPTLVHSHYYPGGIDSLAKGTFTLDESLGPDMYFFIYYYDLTHVGNTIELTMLSGKTITSAYMQEDGDANVIFINIPSAERGEWRYKIENRADSHQGLVMQVTTSENKERKIKMRVWTSNANNLVRVNNSTSPLIIYAELKDDDVPILNARVVAKLKRLGTNESGSTYDSIYIHLFDNGFGDPDVTGGDGVYSRYLPYVRHQRILPGHYELTVSANNNDGLAVKPVNNVLTRGSYNYLESNEKGACCGSNIKYDHMTPLSVFQQSVTYGVIGIISQVSEDTFPPNRILDLHALVNKTTQEVSLRWTAPGDDYDWGIAENYEAILASSWSEAMVFSGQKISGMPSPSSAGIEQSVNILLEIYDRVIYVALRASDDAGNHGAVSNIVTIIVPHPPTTTTAKTTTFMDIETQNYLNEPLGSRVTKPLKSGWL